LSLSTEFWWIFLLFKVTVKKDFIALNAQPKLKLASPKNDIDQI